MSGVLLSLTSVSYTHLQALGLDCHGSRALEGGVALGCLELADPQLARVHARDGHAAVLARGDGGLALCIPRAVGRQCATAVVGDAQDRPGQRLVAVAAALGEREIPGVGARIVARRVGKAGVAGLVGKGRARIAQVDLVGVALRDACLLYTSPRAFLFALVAAQMPSTVRTARAPTDLKPNLDRRSPNAEIP